MADEITFDDCCRIILEQGLPVGQHVAPGNADYRRDLLALLNKEFGIEWDGTDTFQNLPIVRDAEENLWNGGIPAIAASLVRHYGGVSDPFSGYLEYTFAKDEMAVWKVHQTGMCDAATALKQCFVGLFRDLLLLRWPKATDRTTSWARLRAFGLVEPVYDPDEF